MQQRKSHTKSRNGCQGCKARHIKCDEQVPSCANCVAREAECTYLQRRSKKSTSQGATNPDRVRKRKPRITLSDDCPELDGISSTVAISSRLETRPKVHPRSLSASPLAFSSTRCQNPALELELMHRWSTKTWQILYAVPVCQISVQQNLTRASLRYKFMTKALLASAALDTAMYGGGADSNRQTYHRVALELMNEASADYREQLGNITRDNLWLLSEFSGLLGMFHFAVPESQGVFGSGSSLEEDRSVLTRIVRLYDMIVASYELCAINWAWLLESPSSASAIISNYPTDLTLMHNLPPDILDATKRMSEVCRVVRLPPTGNPEFDDDDGQGPFAVDVFSYRVAIGHLRYAYAEDRIKAYCLSVASGAHAAGPEFAEGLRSREPMAMFVVLYWGVLMHWQSHDEMIWWIGSSGREMVRESSELLVHSHIYELDDVKQGVAWARRQVGLEPLLDYDALLFSGVVDDMSDALTMALGDLKSSLDNEGGLTC